MSDFEFLKQWDVLGDGLWEALKKLRLQEAFKVTLCQNKFFIIYIHNSIWSLMGEKIIVKQFFSLLYRWISEGKKNEYQ